MNGAEGVMSLEMGLIYGLVAMGIFITYRVIDFPDLTCDGSFVLGCMTSAVLIKAGMSPLLALICAILAGSLAGLATGLLNATLKVTHLLSGLLVAFMLYSINLKIAGGLPNIALIKERTIFTDFNPLMVLILLGGAVWLGFSYLFATDFGLALRSVGQNRRLALNCGVKVSQMTVIGLMLSNGLIGLGGALFSQHQGFGDISQGIGTVIVGLAAVMLGEKLWPVRSVGLALAACLLGSIVYRLFITLALHSEWLGLETQDLNLITGLLIIGVMQFKKRSPAPC